MGSEWVVMLLTEFGRTQVRHSRLGRNQVNVSRLKLSLTCLLLLASLAACQFVAPRPTSTPMPTATPQPTITPAPTATSVPTPTVEPASASSWQIPKPTEEDWSEGEANAGFVLVEYSDFQ